MAIRLLVVCWVIGLALQSVDASVAAPALASRSNGQWDVATSPDTPLIKLDGRAVSAINGRAALNKLTLGVHIVEMGTSPTFTLLVRESGTQATNAAPTPTRVFDTVVEDPKLRHPAPTLRVMQGDVVQLNVSSAAAVAVHLHGYDIEGHAGHGMPLSIAFDANLAGRFSFETHGETHNSFAFLEVLPR